MKSGRILHVVAGMDPESGGVCQAVRTMITGLTELGIYNEVACLDDPDAGYVQNVPFRLYALGPAKGPWAYSKRFRPWLIANLDRFEAVIIHGLWLSHSYTVRKAIQQLKRRQMPSALFPKVYVMPHGMLDPYFQRANGRRFKAWRNSVYWKLVEGYVVNEANGLLFTCSEEQRLAYQPFNPYRPLKEAIVGLGVQRPPVFSITMQQAFLKQCSTLQNGSYILFLSRLHEKKGVDLLIRAYAQLQAEIKNKDSKATGKTTSMTNKPEHNSYNTLPQLVIAGPGLEDSYGRKLQQLLSRYPEARDHVHFTGMLSGDAKWGAFYGCEAFILPSHQENFGIAVVEALACGKPVLISNQVNIFKEIEAAGAGLVEEDTLIGTRKLLQRWVSLTEKDKIFIDQHAKNVFEKNFSIIQAASRVQEAINT